MESKDIEHCLKSLEERRSSAVLTLTQPGPNPELLNRLLKIALRVPDHGKLEPWRLIVLEGEAKVEASKKLAEIYLAENPNEEDAMRDKKAAKIATVFAAAPVTIIIISQADSQLPKPEWEQILSAGAVCMNLLTAAHFAGLGAVWLTGWAAYNQEAKKYLRISKDEQIAGFIHIGTQSMPQKDRCRPDLEKTVTWWHSS